MRITKLQQNCNNISYSAKLNPDYITCVVFVLMHFITKQKENKLSETLN